MSIKIAENIFLKIKNQIQSIVNSHGIMGKARRSRSRSVKKCTHTFKSGRITRNPFLNFLRDFRRSNGGLKLTELTKRGAEVWRKMSDRQRSPYCHLARQAPKRRSRRRYKRSKRRRRRRGRSAHKRQDGREDRVRSRGEDRGRYEDGEVPPKEESVRREATDVG